jgi:hypothetical protein
MIDPLKGQPWYEAIMWGVIAEKAGLTVTDEAGNKIMFNEIITRAYTNPDQPRMKLVISAEPQIHQKIINTLKVRENAEN